MNETVNCDEGSCGTFRFNHFNLGVMLGEWRVA